MTVENNDVVTPEVTVEPNEVTPEVTPEVKPTKNDLMRELSKEYGFNLFDADGIAKFKEFTDSQKTDLEKAQEVISGFEKERTAWQTEKLKYDSKLKASELGIHPDNLEDALKLADNDPNKLPDVIKKYPNFTKKDGIQIGLQNPNNTAPTTNSEVEAYMAQNKRIYGK